MNPKKIASQLRCPSGEQAAEAALTMNDANRSVNQKCVELLQISAGNNVLEIGPGNGAFAAEIVHSAERVTYTGLDWSAEMVAEASQLNHELVAEGRVQFRSGSSDKLKFAPATFDKALCVHTMYFWDHPQDHLAAIRRVLKPDGLFCLTFGDRSFMQDLPFTPYGFTLYDIANVEKLLSAADFCILDVLQHHETGTSNTGEVVEKTINIMLATPR